MGTLERAKLVKVAKDTYDLVWKNLEVEKRKGSPRKIKTLTNGIANAGSGYASATEVGSAQNA